jgi:glycosyltransferase involved in cell wall biosynthesis
MLARIVNPFQKQRPSEEPLRIAYLMQYFQPGGLERIVLALAQGLKRHGAQPVVVAYFQDGEYKKVFDEQGIQTMFFNEGEGIRWTFPVRLAHWLKREGIQLLHTHHLGPYLYGGMAARLRGIPLVHTEHSRELYNSMRHRWIGRSMDYLGRVIAVTPEISQWRQKHFGRSTQVILNGVPLVCSSPNAKTKARNALGLKANAFAIGCVARLSPEKDHATLLSAFSLMHRQVPHARLVIVGDGPERKTLHNIVEQSGLSTKVLLLGHRNDIEKILPAFDLVTLSSQREGLPLALLEAMAHGIPVVATRVGGIPALLEHGGGLLVEPGQPDHLAQAVIQLIDKPDELQRQAKLARQIAEKKYSQEVMIDKHIHLYQDLIRGIIPCGSCT